MHEEDYVQSTFAGIELGKRGLISHTQGLHTVGHNLNSAAVPGYSRQRIEVVAMAALYYPAYNREETAGQILKLLVSKFSLENSPGPHVLRFFI